MTGDGLTAKAIVIRPAQTADARALVAYMTALTAEGLDTISVRAPPTLEDQHDWLLRAKLSDRILILVATCQDEVVGLLDLTGGRRREDRHLGRLGMAVAKAWRGSGVGRRLLTAAIDEARDWPGFCRIELECTSWNASAIGLYLSLGFVLEGRRCKAINLRGEPEDMLLMALVW